MSADARRVREVFERVADTPPAERGAVLDRLCAGDAALRAEVEAVLRAAEENAAFLGSPTALPPEGAGPGAVAAGAGGNSGGGGESGGGSDSGRGAALAEEQPGARLGPYKLLQRLGEGGFGVVFMAEQEAPVRRRVALKIIKAGMDTRAVIARFEAERQALALMEHPHIARVLDAGATASGRPFFVMELVRGEPITSYADAHNLGVRERLELFAQVCRAVQHAHSKGVIHRDIKPGNVLVSTQDGRPHAKVIDFGIAKATEARLTERTLFTDFRQLIGTPEYMSPEQAGGALDIDTRTDVYALGVLLYELLTGTTPVDGRELRRAGYAEMQRIIREVEAPRPSTRLSTLGAIAAQVAARRGTEPGRLGAVLRGDLDWVVLRALAKERARRYETPSALAEDLGRFLAGRPVEAAPPSAWHAARKFARRNAALTLGAGVAALALLVGGGAAAYGYATATRALAGESAARRDETEARTRAEDAADRSARLAAFLDRVVRQSVRVPGEPTPSTADVIRAGREAGATDAVLIPALLAQSDAQLFGGDPEEAGRAAEAALGMARAADDPGRQYLALIRLGTLATRADDHARGATLRREARALAARAYGEVSMEHAQATAELAGSLMQRLAQDASVEGELADTWGRACEILVGVYGADDRRAVEERLYHTAWLLTRSGALLERGLASVDEVRAQVRRVIGPGAELRHLARAQWDVLSRSAPTDALVSAGDDVADSAGAIFGADSADRAEVLANIVATLARMERGGEAAARLAALLDVLERTPDTRSASFLAKLMALHTQVEPVLARRPRLWSRFAAALLERQLALVEAGSGAEFDALVSFGDVFARARDWERVDALDRGALARLRESAACDGEGSPAARALAVVLKRLGIACVARGNAAEGEALLREAVERCAGTPGVEARHAPAARLWLARTLLAQATTAAANTDAGTLDAASAMLDEAWAGLQTSRTAPDDAAWYADHRAALARARGDSAADARLRAEAATLDPFAPLEGEEPFPGMRPGVVAVTP